MNPKSDKVSAFLFKDSKIGHPGWGATVAVISQRHKFKTLLNGRVEAALEALNLLGPNSVMCFLGVYREKKACEKFCKVLTLVVLDNRLMFGSVSSNKNHFKMGIKDMFEIRRRYKNELNRLITKKLYLADFKQPFNSGREDIKNIIYFK